MAITNAEKCRRYKRRKLLGLSPAPIGRPRTRAPEKSTLRVRRFRALQDLRNQLHLSSSDESSGEKSDSEDIPKKSRKTTKGKTKVETRKRNQAVNYQIPSTDSESEQNEFMDFDEEETRQTIVVETGNTDAIEKACLVIHIIY